MVGYIFLAVAVFVIIFLLHFFISLNKNEKNRTNGQAQKSSSMLLSNCPLCKTPLLKGEDIFSKVFRPMTVSDQRCIILGCPHCYPTKKQGVERRCPVCHKIVPDNGHLVSRLFNKTKDGKKHVVVTGCSVCCKYEPV